MPLPIYSELANRKFDIPNITTQKRWGKISNQN